jgi:hypothetical protein
MPWCWLYGCRQQCSWPEPARSGNFSHRRGLVSPGRLCQKASRNAAVRTVDVSEMCPRVQRPDNQKCRFAGTLAKPSDGLEPSTPSLPCARRGKRSQPAARVLACSCGSAPIRFATACRRLQPRGSIKAPSPACGPRWLRRGRQSERLRAVSKQQSGTTQSKGAARLQHGASAATLRA